MVQSVYRSSYDPRDHYWIVANTPSQLGGGEQVYSSARAAYIIPDDQIYQDWLAAGGKPTLIATHDELHLVLDAQYPLGTQKGQTLDLLNQGLRIISNANHALDGTYAIDPVSCQTINSIQTAINNKNISLPGGSNTFVYPDMYGNVHSWGATAFTDFSQVVMDYVYAVRMNAMSDGSMNIPNQPIQIDGAAL